MTAPIRAMEAQDPSQLPLDRLGLLMDVGTLTPRDEPDDSNVRVADGRIAGARVLAYCTDASRMGATTVLAWPSAQVAVMGAEAAVKILHRRKLAAIPEQRRAGALAELVEEHEQVAGGVARGLEPRCHRRDHRPAADPAADRRGPGRVRPPRQRSTVIRYVSP